MKTWNYFLWVIFLIPYSIRRDTENRILTSVHQLIALYSQKPLQCFCSKKIK